MSIVPPSIRRPTPDDVRECAAEFHMDLSDDEVAEFVEFLDGMLDAWERLDDLVDDRTTYEYTDRDPGYRPDEREDPLNVAVTKCHVAGVDDGPLSGYAVGLKDNVAVRGVELTAGSRIFEGFQPDHDATVVTRLLDAGATVTAKLAMEDMAVSGTGDQAATGPVLNPRDPEHLAGGSSSGSGAAVVSDAVDVAIGTDQAGSIRIPAAVNGCVGLKPTFGLVPYTGIVEVAPSIDHAGPMAASVEDCALVLDAIAGPDGDDPRQQGTAVNQYARAVGDVPDAPTVGVLEQGFGWDVADPGVDETVRDALADFETSSATLQDASVPLHLDGRPIRNAITTEAHTAMTKAEGVGHFHEKPYDEQFASAFAHARRVHADDFPLSYKLRLILGEYLTEQYHGLYHAKAQNARHRLRDAYDEALQDVDVLAMPTVPRVALEHEGTVTRREYMDRRRGMIYNTSPFNVTGHPAISVPCGTVDGLPVGLMFVGARGDDARVLRVARAFESDVGWSEPAVVARE